MRGSARIGAAAELLQSVFAFERPADAVVNEYFKARRYIGGGDRRAVSALVWDALRRYGRLSLVCPFPLTGRAAVAAMLRYAGEDPEAFFTGEGYAPSVLTAEERAFLRDLPDELPPPENECPQELADEIDDAEKAAMAEEAPFDLRVNTLKTSVSEVLDLLAREGVEAEKTPFSPIGVRLKGRPNLRASDLIVNGLADVQDEGSQIVSLLTRAKAGETVIDWCAGAGGKTLALAAIMENKGALYAADANPRRLKDLPDRAVRAGVRNVVLLNGYDALKTYDLVLVDAPCSGTGTWRRAPDARWRTTAETVKKLTAVQEDILEKACRYVRKGGRLFYITCSLLREENENRAERFLSAHPEFISEDLAPVLKEKTGIETTEKTVRLFPSVYGTDGFFAASFLRI